MMLSLLLIVGVAAHRHKPRATLQLRGGEASKSQAFADAPGFKHDEWLSDLHGDTKKGGSIGKHEKGPRAKVLVIGAGCSGACAAFELANAGVDVVLVDAEEEVGGRCNSVRFDNDVAKETPSQRFVELGCMRFTQSEACMSHYLDFLGIQKGGIAALPVFPDPGQVPTWVIQGKSATVWLPTDKSKDKPWSKMQRDFLDVFVNHGIHDRKSPHEKRFHGPAEIQRKLQSDNATKHEEAKTYWQAYIDEFESQSFYSVLYELFGEGGKYKVYNSTDKDRWTLGDFENFGSMGFGSGGMHVFNDICFLEMVRLFTNGFEDGNQRAMPMGTRQLPLSLVKGAYDNGCQVITNTRVTSIDGDKDKGFTVKYDGDRHQALDYGSFDRVILATTTRAMEISTNVCDIDNGLVTNDVAKAIHSQHVIAAAKVGVRIKKFWKGENEDYPRVLLCDNAVGQVYTLDYDDESALCFITYEWGEDAIMLQALSDVETFRFLQGKLREYKTLHSDNKPLVKWIDSIKSYIPGQGCVDDDDEALGKAIQRVEWQSKENFWGGWKEAKPGQGQYVQRTYFDYLKAKTPKHDTGCYLANDCISFTSGWVEGAMHTGLNAAAAVLTSLKGYTLYTTKQLGGEKVSPMTLDPAAFTYFK